MRLAVLVALLLVFMVLAPIVLGERDSLGGVGDYRTSYGDFTFTHDEVLTFYRIMTRRWYNASTFKMFHAIYYGVAAIGVGPGLPFTSYGVLTRVSITVHEADIIGGVVYLYPPRGLTIYEYNLKGYKDVYIVRYQRAYPLQLNVPWAVNFMYDYIGVFPKIVRDFYLTGDIQPDAYYFYTTIAPDYYLLEHEYKCSYEFPEKPSDSFLFNIHLDPMRFLCYTPPIFNITPKVFVVPELYEELRSKHGVYPIYIWINDKIRYVAILAGLETTIGGVIRPDVHNLIRKYTGLNLTRDYVIFVVVAPMFANRGLYTVNQDNIPDPRFIASRRGCLITSFASWRETGWDIDFWYSIDVGRFEDAVSRCRSALNESIPVYTEAHVAKYYRDIIRGTYYEELNLPLVYVYEPRIVIPEGVYHAKPNYTYIAFPEFVRDLRAGNLTLPPPNTERVFLNETDIPEEFPDEPVVSQPTPTTTVPQSTPSTTTFAPTTSVDVLGNTNQTETQSVPTTISTPASTLVITTAPQPTNCVYEPCPPQYWLLTVCFVIGFLAGILITRFTRRRAP